MREIKELVILNNISEVVKIPGDDINVLKIYGIKYKIDYHKEITYCDELGRYPVNCYSYDIVCEKLVLKLEKNKIEDSIMKILLETDNIFSVKLFYQDGEQKHIYVPFKLQYVQDKTNIFSIMESEKHNLYQRLVDEGTYYTISIG